MSITLPRVLVRGLLPAAIMALAPLAVTATAQAEASAPSSPITTATLRNGICEAGEFCVFRDRNLTGPPLDFATGADALAYSPFRWPIVGGVVNDQASSSWNRSSCSVRVYRHGQLNGPGVTILSGRSLNVDSTPVGDNMASSHDASC